ncbi:hypothetical protein BJ508DRAFT_333594 [Ascobolus immersus RN42]|uniref:Uncharacterized protein n=1 Tax=Ascobolus immersus RN42 TaxID=1160509 RepID=A0A3N4HKW1_ASCIM|nr:hypothetical protein BJ508DRAFT_333594 [Ascobolus immersus RN42]
MAPYFEVIQHATPSEKALEDFIALWNKALHERFPHYNIASCSSLENKKAVIGHILLLALVDYHFPVPLAERLGNEVDHVMQLRVPAATMTRIREGIEKRGVKQWKTGKLLTVGSLFGVGKYWQGLCRLYPELAENATFE